MKISLLFPAKVEKRAAPIPKKLLYHLSLDRSFSHISKDVKNRESFLSVLSKLVADPETVFYRQEVLKDFLANPTLFEELVFLSARFSELKTAYRSAGKDGYRLRTTGTASADSAKNLVATEALSCKRALLFVKAYGELFSRYELHAKGLLDFFEACASVSDHPSMDELLTVCSKYENFSTNGFLDFKFSMNGEGHVETYELIDHRYIHVTDTEPKKKGISLFKRSADPTYPCERFYPGIDGLFESFAVSAMSELSGLFGSLCNQIFTAFDSLSEELAFYTVAIQYVNTLSEKAVPICYPTVSDTQESKLLGLYDLYLALTKADVREVIPNDFSLSNGTSGLLIFGNNGNGKTVYLRSVATAQILAQAGLPIPCVQAQIPLFSQIVTQFSEAEKEFCEGNDAGRFEQEVRELAEMIDTLTPGSLVFLNETFQSTAYAEGAEGLCEILRHFSALGIRWVLVSHLHQLKDRFKEEEAMIAYVKHFRIGIDSLSSD